MGEIVGTKGVKDETIVVVSSFASIVLMPHRIWCRAHSTNTRWMQTANVRIHITFDYFCYYFDNISFVSDTKLMIKNRFCNTKRLTLFRLNQSSKNI